MESINSSWQFSETWSEDFLNWKDEDVKEVRIPHTVKMLPLHYADDRSYQMISGYRRKLMIPEEAKGKRVFLRFDGAAHIATLYVNRKEVCTHQGGYTAFRCEISDLIKAGKECEIAVRLDSTENGSIPPFGYVIDYLTYGGIYRPVWLEIEEEEYISDIFVQTRDLHTAKVAVTIDGDPGRNRTIRIKDTDGNILCETQTKKNEIEIRVDEAKPWDIDSPKLYLCEVSLDNGSKKEVRFGFRTIRFVSDGFYLNGRREVMWGLDRHQCYPYVGYAVSDSLQVEDARILKKELSCNAVRTSHYPQSQAFIDACDELGLLVFTEIPGWQHIGDEAWKEVACRNVEEMVLQYRNHPSIVLWGVRINESQDDDDFYRKTNAIAHRLDPSRPTSGVRYLKKSSLLEDVYAFNDFSHSGKNAGARKKKDVTPDMNKALLISEANGHMFPTKAFDKWALRQEHALRHAKVMDAAMGSGEHAGVFEWCMFDYATHKDFGSGDRICYHGVMDSFRNPKLAASVYASQGEKHAVLEVGNPMDIGDYAAGNLGEIYAFTNADCVELYKNDVFVKRFESKGWKGMEHGPVLIDDTIGEMLETQEHMPKAQASAIRDCMLAAGKYGFSALPARYKAELAWIMLRYKMSFEDGYALYGKYVGNWGGEATRWRFDAKKDGKVVRSVTKTPGQKLHLEVKVSKTRLEEGDVYDMSAVRIMVHDDHCNHAPYAQLPLSFETSGPIEIAGPHTAVLEGGMSGLYIRTTGTDGTGELIIRSEGIEDVRIEFEVRKQGK